jgi:hypothetical protein
LDFSRSLGISGLLAQIIFWDFAPHLEQLMVSGSKASFFVELMGAAYLKKRITATKAGIK